jgi:hypothetical protein
MAFNDLDHKRIEKALSGFLARRRPPPSSRPQLDIGYRLVGQSVELLEIRPQWDQPNILREHPFAKATFVRTRSRWNVFWRDSSLRWTRYEPMASVASIEEFLDIVDADAYRCFFG